MSDIKTERILKEMPGKEYIKHICTYMCQQTLAKEICVLNMFLSYSFEK